MNENEKVMLDEEEIVDTYEETEESGHGVVGALIAGAVIVGGAVVGILYKNRAKLEAKRIEKLRKKGYVIYNPETEGSNLESDEETE